MKLAYLKLDNVVTEPNIYGKHFRCGDVAVVDLDTGICYQGDCTDGPILQAVEELLGQD